MKNKVKGGKLLDSQLGIDILRKESRYKVTGAAKYTIDISESPMLHAKLLTSPHAHGRIVSIDTAKAWGMPGVKAVITGYDTDIICGSLLRDMPPLAKDKVRYFGEPVAMVVAAEEQQAMAAAAEIAVNYSILPIVNSIQEAIKPNPIIIHENLTNYEKMIEDVYPIENSNISHQVKIRKGDMPSAWAQSDLIAEGSFKLPQSDHAAMETRAARCKIQPDGKVIITSSSQAPYSIKELICEYFKIPEGDIVVKVPFVGGGFGGKSAVQLEVLAVLASQAAGGKCVSLVNTREQDFVTSPCHMGLEANIKLGAKSTGEIVAAEMVFYINSGAYADISPKLTKAVATDCAGPYNFPNIHCDCFSVYTNFPYATSFRGFGHTSLAFCIERMMDKLADKLHMDPIEIRRINALKEGDYTPTQVKVTLSNTGDLSKCLDKLKQAINWDEGQTIFQNENLIRAKGIACLNKTSDTPTAAAAGVILNFNSDGSINLNCGAVEIGPGMKTTAAQILAEKLKMSPDRIFVKMEVDTQVTPVYWKTVASMTTYMIGNAVLNAAEDVISQLLQLGSVIMRCPVKDLDIGEEKVFLKADPSIYVSFKDMVYGYKYPEGNAVMGPIIGRGSFIMNHLTLLDKETGKGKPGRSWTVGAQAVEIEYDRISHTYRLLKAATVIDAGKVINPKNAKGVIMGGMCMGLGLAVCEDFLYDENAVVKNTSFRTYKMLRYGETPDYLVDFVETPQIDAPFGARGIAEHGIIGIPAAVANAISKAAEIDVTLLPVTPEYIWRQKTGL